MYVFVTQLITKIHYAMVRFAKYDMLLKLFSFRNCSFSTKWMDYELNSLPEISNDAWNIFQKRGMHFHLNINRLLSKIDEICCIAEITNASVIELSKTKLDKF